MNHVKQISNPANNQLIGLAPDDLALHERIAKRAYYLWLANGSQHGDHLRYWLEAESEELKAMRPEQSLIARPTSPSRKPRSASVSHHAVHGK
jgi:hypothetical protein